MTACQLQLHFNFPVRELTQPWCEYPLKWAITSWWWDHGLLYIPCSAGAAWAGTNFTPWWDEAVAYGNIAHMSTFTDFLLGPGLNPSHLHNSTSR